MSIDDETTPDEQSALYAAALDTLIGRIDDAAKRKRDIIMRDWVRHNERHGLPIPVTR